MLSGRYFRHGLRLMLIQIKRRIELRLFRLQFPQTGFMLERLVCLRPVIRQGLFLPLDFVLFLIRAPVETAQGVVDTRYGALRAVGVQSRLIRLLAPDTQVRVAVLEVASPAQSLESFIGPRTFSLLS